MTIRTTEDILVPGIVAGVNIMSRTAMPEWHDTIIYAMTAIGYGADLLRFGPPILKQIAVCSAPLTIDKLYERFKGTPVARAPAPVKMSQVRRYPSSATDAPFQGVKLT